MKIVYIEWCDAINNHSSNWSTRNVVEEWAEKSEWIICECGFIFKETKEYLCLVSSWKKEDDFTEEQFSLLKKIPKTWIKKRILLNYHD